MNLVRSIGHPDYSEKAHEEFASDKEAAASDIRKAASMIRMESNRASGATKERLDRAVTRLRETATGVKDGTTKAASELNRPFAQAEYAPAADHRSEAQSASEREEREPRGMELTAAQNDVRMHESAGVKNTGRGGRGRRKGPRTCRGQRRKAPSKIVGELVQPPRKTQ